MSTSPAAVPYAFSRHSEGNDRGERYSCPAQEGKVRCPLKAWTVRGPVQLTLLTHAPEVVGTPLPDCCKQQTVTLPWTVSPKLRQQHMWGSREWTASFGRRSRIEAWFARIKSPKTGRVRRGWVQVPGLVKTRIMVTLAAVATNIQVTRRWAADNPGITTDKDLTVRWPQLVHFEELEPSENAEEPQHIAPRSGPRVAGAGDHP